MKEKKMDYCKLLILLCGICYFVSYITRINYAAVLLEIVQTENVTKTAASMAITGSFITYGAGQLISGWMGDHFNPRRVILSGLIITTCMNILVPIFVHPGLVLIFWCINGFAQALMWPPMVRILSDYLTEEQYKKGCIKVLWGSAAGNIVIYLLAPACILWKGWKSLFFICAGTALIFSVVWSRGVALVEKNLVKQERKAKETRKGTGAAQGEQKTPTRTIVMMLAVVMIAIVMQGILRDGVTTWMPTYVSETFQLASSVSILSGVLLPMFGLIWLELASVINRRWIHNELVCGGTIFLIGSCSALLLAMFSSLWAPLSVLLAALLTGSMYGVNVILTSLLPPYFRSSGKVGLISGVLNSCTYVGSAVSSYGIAWIAERSGWGSVLWVWTIVGIIGTVLCLAAAGSWGRFAKLHK